ncbi:MAG: asparagine--tRNA ligase [Firmicutes bacterium]|nr:asparagine--tRNA ligase [Bacillota bacterium]
MKHIDIAEIFKNEKQYLGKTVTVCGWVRTSRESKNVAFIELNDGTSLKHIQIVADKAVLTLNKELALGASLMVNGTVVPTQNNTRVEINAAAVTLLGECPPEYPLQKKRHTMDFLRTIPHLRVRTNTFNAMLRVRSVLSAAINKYFCDNNYVYVHTPIITGSDCEGAGEVFRVSIHEWKTAFATEKDYYDADFFGQRAGLTVSGQLEGEVAAMGLGKIYTFGPTFRAEKSNTTRHAAEFWQIEPEVAFCELFDIIAIAEELIKYIISAVLKGCRTELEFFEAHFEADLVKKLTDVVGSSFEILEYEKAVEILQKSGKPFVFEPKWGEDLATEHERYITEEVFKKPVFVINYPKKIKSFYMKQNDDGMTVAATDLLVPGIGEIIGCSQREADYDKLLEAIKERGMNVEQYKHYLELRQFGSCPHSGFGLGLERILLYVTGLGNIRDVQLYPRTVGDLR